MLFKAAIMLPVLLAATASASSPHILSFNSAGETTAPTDYREWVFLSAGLNMNYSAGGPAADADMFDNVFVDPASWRRFKATGSWPEGTIFVKEGRHGSTKGSINRGGQFQDGGASYVELHVRDKKRFASGWGFFELRPNKPGRVIPATANCYSCHQQNGAVETTFTQFYPTAKAIAFRAGTFEYK